ncbi:MAG: NAD(P)H-quinone oxidoreductase subunit 3, chloroplastic [Phycisphaerae bacterium]|nr:NAD(P)H-quinone oxidoreductase subunit 3, chloroplastic [Phycisphaerae bacterium]
MTWAVMGITLFVLLGVAFVLGSLLAGKLIRPSIPHPQKGEIYECGEPTVGDSRIQFDLRFYVVALVFVIFDVEVALLYPWARVYLQNARTAFVDLLFFFGVLLVGFAYLWRFGYLDWVRSSAGQQRGGQTSGDEDIAA